MKNSKIIISILGAVATLGGCTVGPDYVPPSNSFLKQELSEAHFYRDENLWKNAAPADTLPKGDWWAVFNDPVLSALLKQCKESNPNLTAAYYRVEQARQAARMDAADLYPQAGGNASFTRNEGSRNAANYSRFDKWATGLTFTWDLDIFGRVQSIIESDIAKAQASIDLYNNLILAMQTQVASVYFTLRQYTSEADLLIRTLDTRKNYTELVRRRVKLDYASDLDLQRALQQEYEAAAQLSTLERQIALAKNQLAILVGTTPASLEFKDAPLGDKLPLLPAAVPSQLLERRPDIAAAEREVYAANARIGVAQAGFFPTVSITANTGLEAKNIDFLINSSSFAWGVSPQIYIPIFQAGKIYAQKQVALAAHKETLENYKATVLKAIGEVEDALAEVNYLAREYQKRSAVTQASLRVQELTITQYELGSVDYFSVSDAQRQALLNEREQLRLQGNRFRACVNLIAALGGGWENQTSQYEDIVPNFYEATTDPTKSESK